MRPASAVDLEALEMVPKRSLLSERDSFCSCQGRPTFLPPALGENDIESSQAPQGRLQDTICKQSFSRSVHIFRCIVFTFVATIFVSFASQIMSLLLSSTIQRWKDVVPSWMLISINRIEVIGVFVVSVMPSVCCMLLWFWKWAALPDGDHFAENIRFSMRASLGLLAPFCVCGHYSAPRWFAFAYFTVGIYCLLTSPVAKRLCRIYSFAIPMLLRYALLEWWSSYNGVTEDKQKAAYSRLNSAYAPLLFDILVELGGIWVKLGQKLTSFPVLPHEFQTELKKLQNQVPPYPAEMIKQIIAAELKQPLNKMFATFEDKPLGAASIGQVHGATLLDGQKVVVKVQYPHVRDTLSLDLTTIEFLLWLRGQRAWGAELKKVTLEELDFVREANTLDRVHDNTRQCFPEVQTPVPIHSLCTESVLVMTVVQGVSLMDAAVRMLQTLAKMVGMDGIPLDDVMAKALDDIPASAQAPGAPYRKEWRMLRNIVVALDTSLSAETKGKLIRVAISAGRTAANLGVALYNNSAARFGAKRLDAMASFDMVALSANIWRVFGHALFVDGFMNADPHPGNLMVDEKTGRLGLIDFGNTLELSVEIRVKFARLLLAVAHSEELEVAQAYAQLGLRTKRMKSSLLSKLAHIHFGAAPLSPRVIQDLLKEIQDEGGAPLELGEANLMVQAIVMLRGSSMCLGTITTHYPAAIWIDFARDCLQKYATQFPFDSPIQLDLHQPSDLGRKKRISLQQAVPTYYDAESEEDETQPAFGKMVLGNLLPDRL